MPYNGSGSFTLVTGNPVVTGTVINSTVHNNTQNDIAAGLTNVITRDGQSVPFGNLPMGGFKHTGAADATVAGQYLTFNQGIRAAQLADTTSAAAGSGLSGFDGQLNYAADTIGWAAQLGGVRLEWFYEVADGNDYLAAFNRAVTYLASLTGPAYADSMGQAPYGYGVSRALNLAGKKYPISNTLTLTADVGIYANGGGFYALPTFPAAAYMIDTGVNPYGGRIENMTLDGSDMNVKGVRIRNAHATRWHGLSVVSCRNDGITYEAGAEFYLTDFEVSGAATPNSVSVAGLRVLGSDAGFSSGVIKYTPIGVYASNGGNCEFTAIHAWGLYAAFKQYVSFWFVNAVRNTITACYGDSPAKQDYAQDNLVVLNSIPNGGICFYFDANSAQNVLQGCRGYVNTTAYAAAGLPGTNQFYDIYCAAQFVNVYGLVHNYAGNWAGDIRFASNAIRDTCLVVGSPNTANGVRPAVLAQVCDNGASSTNFAIQNTVSSPSTSSAVTYTMTVGANSHVHAMNYGASGASFVNGALLGVEKYRYAQTLTTLSQSNLAEGDMAFRFASGIGSFNPMALYRNDGGAIPSTAFAAAKFGSISSNSRSINAAGTINASGADYAEYMRKSAGCGEVQKGQIVGIDAQGEVTDKWAEAVAFAVKSTNPSYVGGDNWGAGLDGEELEAERAKVDRIAFSGQVPVNHIGATPGEFIIPCQSGASIGSFATKSPTLDQYMNAVGRVIAVEQDGRARIIVKVS